VEGENSSGFCLQKGINFARTEQEAVTVRGFEGIREAIFGLGVTGFVYREVQVCIGIRKTKRML
jgi:hypothetical protein